MTQNIISNDGEENRNLEKARGEFEENDFMR